MVRKKKNKEHKKLESFSVDNALFNQLTCLECDCNYDYWDWYMDRFSGDEDLMSLLTVGRQYTIINKDTMEIQKVAIEYCSATRESLESLKTLMAMGYFKCLLQSYGIIGRIRFKFKKLEEGRRKKIIRFKASKPHIEFEFDESSPYYSYLIEAMKETKILRKLNCSHVCNPHIVNNGLELKMDDNKDYIGEVLSLVTAKIQNSYIKIQKESSYFDPLVNNCSPDSTDFKNKKDKRKIFREIDEKKSEYVEKLSFYEKLLNNWESNLMPNFFAPLLLPNDVYDEFYEDFIMEVSGETLAELLE